MADGQKRKFPLSGYGKGMSRGLQPRDIPMPYPPQGILHFYSPAMWSCYMQLFFITSHKFGKVAIIKEVIIISQDHMADG